MAIRLFDTYLSEEDGEAYGFRTFHVYVCASILTFFSKQLKELEFQDMVLFIQHLPTSSWTDKEVSSILSQAFVYQSLFKGSPSHLK
jgi:hypothetical protein